MNWSSNAQEQWHKLHARSFVTITPHSPQDLDWFRRQIWRFSFLLTLVTDEVVSPTGIEVFLADDKYPGWYLYQAAKEREPDEKATPVGLFHLALLVDHFESMLNKWFAVSYTMLDAIHLMMDAQRNQEHSTQGRFLLFAHAVEVVSRATTSSEYMQEADYEKVINALNAAIPKEVDSDHRASLKSKIKFGNEYAFHKRIKVLLESLADEGARARVQRPREILPRRLGHPKLLHPLHGRASPQSFAARGDVLGLGEAFLPHASCVVQVSGH